MTEISPSVPTPGVPQHIRETFRLALPVMLARCGLVIMITIDTVMTGRAGSDQLAYYGIGYAPQITMLTIGIGLLVGTVVLSAQAVGAGRPELAGRIWRLGLLAAFVLGSAYGVALMFGEPMLLLMEQTPEMAHAGGGVLFMWAIGMPGVLMYVATSSFLEGVSRPVPGMIVTLGANIVDIFLNWAMIYGHLGFPAMGAEGAVLSTSITRWLMFGALFLYVMRMEGHERFGVSLPLRGHYGQMRKLLLLGLPLALSIGFESSAFTAATTFAGWLGKASLAAYQVAINVNAVVFMLAIGISTATAVRVANAVGRGDAVAVRRAGWVGTLLVIPTMLIATVFILAMPEAIAAAYTDDALVIAIAVPLFAVTGWMVIVDGAQAVLLGAVRGAADITVPTVIYGFAFWALGVPLAYAFGFPMEAGVIGLVWGLFLSLIVAMLLLAWRFHVLSRRVIAPL